MQVFSIRLQVDYDDSQTEQINLIETAVRTAAKELQALVSLVKDKVEIRIMRSTPIRDYAVDINDPEEDEGISQ